MGYNNSNVCNEQSCANCPLKKYSLLDGLSYSELEKLNAARSQLHFQTGEYIFRAGMRSNGLFCLSKGKVKIIDSSVSGNEQILFLHKPVDFLGFCETILNSKFSFTACALEESTVCIIDSNVFHKIINSNIDFANKINQFLALEIKNLNKRIISLTQKHMRARMADSLLTIRNTFGTCQNEQWLNLTLKRRELAAMSNMNTSNAIRVLSDFKSSGLIQVDGKRIRIENVSKLQNISLMG